MFDKINKTLSFLGLQRPNFKYNNLWVFPTSCHNQTKNDVLQQYQKFESHCTVGHLILE